jgi:hypothetical protein
LMVYFLNLIFNYEFSYVYTCFEWWHNPTFQLLALSIPDESYSINKPCALSWMSTFLLQSQKVI